MRTVYLLLALPLFAIGAEAQEARGAYFGLSYGNLNYRNVNDVDGYEVYGIGAMSETADHARLLGGYRVHEQFAVEVGWGRAGLVDYDETTVYSAPGERLLYSRNALDVEIETVTVRVVGSIPFRRLSLFGGAGYYDAGLNGSYLNAGAYLYYDSYDYYSYWYDTTPEYREYVNGPDPLRNFPTEFDHVSTNGVTLAGGVQFDFDRGPSLRLEYEYFFTPSDVRLSTVNFGVLYRLGRNRHEGA
jgi:hypothetical protein